MGTLVIRDDGWDELNWPKLAHRARYRVGWLAARLSMKVRTFRRRFWLRFEVTPKQRLMEWRGEQADAMNMSDMPIGKISWRPGYTDAAHFGRDQQRRHGVCALRRRAQQRAARNNLGGFGRTTAHV